MRCYALGTCSGDGPFEWFISLSNSFFGSSFFEKQIKQAIEKHQAEITNYCADLNPNETYWMEKDGIYIYVRRVVDDYCGVIVDSKLDQKQITWLSLYLLKFKLEKKTIAANIEEFTQDYKVRKVQKEVDETMQIMLKNIEKMEKRGEALQTLVTKTQDLETSSFQFKKKAADLNSCWPSCTLI
ncbi:hypothetical protein [Legionella hackeliae]|uniref:V-SNARE coiled-coil homology domain-containing protein n=1 Tax=Legionella hackeliae TaxID=449 RepID=A0A0A8ULJ6_LEGHA|nr:hypothetical protein [Legionella hackeliae]KTD10104.1 Synaptobrevin [Legionella hackeliae]CEK09593.1 protein of unknown function [Legionella hackeliae]STX49504.1 Synaptobrevin [Legionella hackeliae]